MQFSFAKGRFAACCLLLGAACAAAGFALGAALSARPSAGKAPAPSVRLLPAAISQPSPPQSQPLPQRLVCLTFDDGPSRTTPAVLEALAAEGVPATFFVVASESNESYLPLVQQAQQAGHEIALHSASHKYSDIYRSADAFWADIELLRQRLAPYVDAEELRSLRFPGGSTTRSATNTAAAASCSSSRSRPSSRACAGWIGTSVPKMPPAKSSRPTQSAAM